MRTSRLEAFSDGVLAIIITIMVLELREPVRTDLASLWHTTGPGLLSYLLSLREWAVDPEEDVIPA